MLTPRSRKPVRIPSFPPVGGQASIRVSRREQMLKPAPGALTRVAEPAGAHDQDGARRRRRATRRAGTEATPNADTSGGRDPSPNTFRGATARFVAFG